jgi:ABC-type bacteriocin/lantibiotic exporter with double-glycine peptidase domain
MILFKYFLGVHLHDVLTRDFFPRKIKIHFHGKFINLLIIVLILILIIEFIMFLLSFHLSLIILFILLIIIIQLIGPLKHLFNPYCFLLLLFIGFGWFQKQHFQCYLVQ